MNNDIFQFIKDNLKIQITDASTPTTCGGECPGNLGIKIELLLRNPIDGKLEIIDSDQCDFT